MKSNYIKMFLAMLIVGSSVVSNKMLVEHVPVFIASELRFAIATIILISLLCKYEGIPKVRAKELLILFLQALTGVFLFSVCMLYGLKHTTALEGGIITSTLPAVMAILAFIVLKERPSLKVLIGIGLTMIGLTFIQTTGSTIVSGG
ncbi:DMT family transporter [Bacillus sp. JCM 19034]|uniref:DMT family transporter n=1 Tax=Bacillus sp. JCM 19034 TaxID=1481928 RepID=UPI000AD977A8|nr:DMT family transporter [Bacillus sp. JCM 19034]